MKRLAGIVEAFEAYGAKLDNPNWAVSAEIPGGVVMSLWESEFHKPGMLYIDRLSRWGGHGNKLFRKHLTLAFEKALPISLVISKASDPAAVRLGVDASKIAKTYSVRPDLVGHAEKFTGDDFEIRFVKRP